MRGRWCFLGSVLVLAGCGQTVTSVSDSNAGASGGGAGGRDPGAAGSSAMSGAGSGGSLIRVEPTPDDASAGVAAADPNAPRPLPEPHAAIPCEEGQAFPGGGGFELCNDGTARRPSTADCASALPRSEPALGRVYEECEYDDDCAEKPNGYCIFGSCFYGCVSDAECFPSGICVCGEVIGTCQAAGCASDADCPAGYPCTGVGSAGILSDFACQSPYDECLVDADCNAFDSKMHCQHGPSGRLCVRRTVG